jgi:hypothetical protein
MISVEFLAAATAYQHAACFHLLLVRTAPSVAQKGGRRHGNYTLRREQSAFPKGVYAFFWDKREIWEIWENREREAVN